MKKDFNHMCYVGMEEWHKLQIHAHFYFSYEKISM